MCCAAVLKRSLDCIANKFVLRCNEALFMVQARLRCIAVRDWRDGNGRRARNAPFAPLRALTGRLRLLTGHGEAAFWIILAFGGCSTAFLTRIDEKFVNRS